ncbi:VWA domain-containing protein [Gramella lutea]|uniref:VWA domain-containing protein n=1 Tax=Christiangramia lutea TaxID=1607951 RepID=A0A9X1V2T1_9FLAO|nr:VWA domain-containing protein [Christiangramia lutea]MCH4821753.1 VWA domain-containing protein [Christiangramia lutea]
MFSDLFPIEWQAFHFLRPGFLWLLIPPIIIFVIQVVSTQQKTKWKKVIAPHLRKFMISKGSNKRLYRINFAIMGILILGVLAIAGPTWKKREIPGQILQTPMSILLELSESMNQTDLQPSRLGRAIFKINDFLDHDPQARASLIGFAGTAHTIVPLTNDYDILKNHIDGLNTQVMPISGSDIAAGLQLADSVMSVTKAPGSIILMVDELDDLQIQNISEFAGITKHKLEIVPFIATSSDEELNSRLNMLSDFENITLHQLTLDDSDMELIARRISRNLEFTEEPEEKEDDWRDAGLILVIPMAFLFVLSFRKGWSIYLLLPLLLTSCSGSGDFKDLWYTKDYQAQQLSDKGDYEEAAESFQDPLRKGIAYYKAENYNQAIRYFREDTSAIGDFNLGLAYYKSGDLNSARLAFQEAVEKDPRMQQAKDFSEQILNVLPDGQELNLDEATEQGEGDPAQNTQNDSMEDLGGGGQEATEEDMEKERREETAVTDIRKGKELDEVPEDIGQEDIQRQDNSKVLMEKIDEDPSLFLQRKFRFQLKNRENKGSNEK